MTHGPDLLQKWLESGSQMVRLISTFEKPYLSDSEIEFGNHSD